MEETACYSDCVEVHTGMRIRCLSSTLAQMTPVARTNVSGFLFYHNASLY